ncbi:MAG: hypothetical protein V9E83_14195 [Baekduia sp.]
MRFRALTFRFVAVLAGVAALPASADAVGSAPGTLDANFADQATELWQGPVYAPSVRPEDLAIMADGRILQSATVEEGLTGRVRRYNEAGSPDQSFTGISQAAFPTAVYDVAAAGDKTIVATRLTPNPLDISSYRTAMHRLSATGRSEWGPVDIPAISVAEIVPLPDGKTIVAGTNQDYTQCLWRLGQNGTIDASFGLGGLACWGARQGNTRIVRLVLQPDGKLLALANVPAPNRGNSDDGLVQVVRFLPSGPIDISFGIGGVVTVAGVPAGLLGVDLTLSPDGRITVLSQDNRGADVAPPAAERTGSVLTALDTNGRLDPSFGNGGTTRLGTAADHRWATGAVVLPDGRIAVLTGTEAGNGFAVVQLTRAGTPDGLFGSGGAVRYDFGPMSPVAIARQPGGRLVISASRRVDARGTDAALLVGLRGSPALVETAHVPQVAPSGPLSGVVNGVTVKEVQVALERIGAWASARSARKCRWITNRSGTTKRSSCKRPPAWMKASGTTEWTFTMRRKLKPGTYRMYVRTIGLDGSTQTTFSPALGNRRDFRVRP